MNDAERELLLICARQTLSPERQNRARDLIDRDLGWPEVVDTAWRHGIAPLLFRHVQSLGCKSIPEAAFHHLRQTYVRSAFRNRMHFAAIADISRALTRHGVAFALLKGAALAQTHYRDRALRPFADIDLLIAEESIDAARQAFLEIGYTLAPELLSEKLNRNYHFNLPLVRRQPVPIHVELHWNLLDSFSPIHFDCACLLARSRAILIGNETTKVFSDEDNLIYLAAHLDAHGYANSAVIDQETDGGCFCLHRLSGNRLIWFTDLHEIIAEGVDWDLLGKRAESANASGALGVTLRMLQQLLQTSIPDDFLGDLPSPAIAWPKRKLGAYVLGLTNQDAPGSRLANILNRKLLPTRRGFELRLIRLIDLWQYIFPQRGSISGNYVAHVGKASLQCAKMFFALCWYRTLRTVRA